MLYIRLRKGIRSCLCRTRFLLLSYFKTGGDLWVCQLISKLNCLKTQPTPEKDLSLVFFVSLFPCTLFQKTTRFFSHRKLKYAWEQRKFISRHLCFLWAIIHPDVLCSFVAPSLSQGPDRWQPVKEYARGHQGAGLVLCPTGNPDLEQAYTLSPFSLLQNGGLRMLLIQPLLLACRITF